MKMTREQKIEWLAKASNEEVVNQLRWAVTGMNVEEFGINTRIEAQEDYELVTAEILKRMER